MGQRATFFDVSKLPLPSVQGPEIADSVETFSQTYAPRVTGTPGDTAAAEHLAAEAEALGYQVEIKEVPLQGGPTGPVGKAVVAIKKGLTKPDEHILMMGHYDTVAGVGGATLEGAYDNGAGTMMIRALAKSFKDVPTNRSLMFVWYNAEEEGLLTSETHAQMQQAAGLKVRAAFGFDMTGIAWPVGKPIAASCLCIWHGEDDEAYEPLQRFINYKVLGFPEGDGLVELRGVNARNSDERSWDVLGYPVMRWAGMQTAADYPAYHMPDDTMATIESVAGGRGYFEMGLRNTLMSAYLTALALDNDMPVLKTSVSNSGATFNFDASAATDADGAPGAAQWDFGDGSKATGTKVIHSYTKPGTYSVAVRLPDSLWPQVGVNATLQAVVPASAVPAVAGPPKPAAPKKKKKAKPCSKGSKKTRAKCRRKLAASKRAAARRRAAAKRRAAARRGR
jgi:hypothetical protein